MIGRGCLPCPNAKCLANKREWRWKPMHECVTPSVTFFDLFPIRYNLFNDFGLFSVCFFIFIPFVWCAIVCTVKSLQHTVRAQRMRSPFFCWALSQYANVTIRLIRHLDFGFGASLRRFQSGLATEKQCFENWLKSVWSVACFHRLSGSPSTNTFVSFSFR